MKWEEVPAKGAVYLLVAEEDGVEKPVLLATVGDLRGALKRRLLELPSDVKSKRAWLYGKVCGRIHWRRVDSSSRRIVVFAGGPGIISPNICGNGALAGKLWIGVAQGASSRGCGRRPICSRQPPITHAGPVRDKHAAARLIETVEDLFDLCRYYSVLMQALTRKGLCVQGNGQVPGSVRWFCAGGVVPGTNGSGLGIFDTRRAGGMAGRHGKIDARGGGETGI